MTISRFSLYIYFSIFLIQTGIAQSLDLSYIDSISTTTEKMKALSLKVENLLYTSPEQTVEVVNKMKEIGSNDANPLIKGIILNSEGMSLFSQKKFEESVKKYLDALQIFEDLDSSRYIAKIYNNLGGSLVTSGDNKRSISYFRKALDFYLKEDDDLWIAHTYNNIGIISMKIKDYAIADESLLKALEYYKKLQLSLYEGITSLNVGNLMIEQERYTASVPFYKRAMELVPLEQNKLLHAACEGGLGTAHLKLNHLEQSAKAFEKSIDIAKSIDHTEQLKVSLEGLANVREKQGNNKEALRIYKEYSIIKDTLFQQQQNQSLVDALEKYETAEKEAQISELNAKNELAQVKLSNSRKSLFAALFGILIICALAYYLFSLNKTVRRQNAIISKALNEKDILLREIHHRVKNNMQFISSLLSLQSDHVLDPTAKSALHKGEHRVQSMALIHQNLYQEEHLTGINSAEYFEKLTQNLFNSYNINDDKITLHTDIDPIIIDVDTMVPLGLIVNELISNTLKHAFPDGRAGDIYLSLKEVNNQLELTVNDNGVGLNVDELDKLNQSFGYKLIEAFRDQLEAEMVTNFDQGFSVKICIKDYQTIAA